MYLRSSFPPIPNALTTNYLHTVFPEGSLEDPKTDNYTIHIDAVTGQRRSVKEFARDVFDALTAFGMDKSYGGLSLENQHSQHRVGILSDNCMEYITIVQALIGLAVPFVPLSPFATQWELAYCLKKADVTHVLVHKAYFPRLCLAAAELGIADENIVLFEGNSSPLLTEPGDMARFQSLRDLIQLVRTQKIPQVPIQAVRPDTLAYLIFSSGTTGSPKAVMISHENLRCTIHQFFIMEAEKAKNAKGSQVEPESSISTNLAFLPFCHTYGLHVTCLRSVPRFQVSFIIMPHWNVDIALELIPKYRINVLPVVPSIVHTLLNSRKFKEIDTSSVRLITFGSAHLSKSVEKTLQSSFGNAELSEGYALSESTLSAIIGARPPPGSTPDKLERYNHKSTGILHVGLEAMILRPDGTHCLPEEPGELYLKGGNIALGYWRDPKATGETFLPTGWLRTGDIFSADTNGYLYFKERRKDTLKISGLQVAPTEIEDTIYAEPSSLVNEVTVVGILPPNHRFRDEKVPRAWIVLSEKGRQLGEAHVRRVVEAWTKERLSWYKWLKGGIQFVDEIPRNATGKVLRRVLHDEYASQHAHVCPKL